MSGAVRYDRFGRAQAMPSEAAKKALAILAGAADKREAEVRAEMKARQEAGQLTPQERLLVGIFGEIK
jgi:hypothetical protein